VPKSFCVGRLGQLAFEFLAQRNGFHTQSQLAWNYDQSKNIAFTVKYLGIHEYQFTKILLETHGINHAEAQYPQFILTAMTETRRLDGVRYNYSMV
jgi:hypothetical protein